MTKKWRWAFPIGLALLGIIIGSFLDLQINQAIYSKGNWFGIGMSAFGTTPVYLMLAAVGMAFILFALKDKKIWLKVLLIIVGVIAILAAIYFQNDMVVSVNAFDIEKEWWGPLVGYSVGVVIAAIGCTLGYFLFKDIDHTNHVLLVIILMPLILGISILIVHFIKGQMSRPRFRFLEAEGGFENFKNWWQSGKDLFEHYGKEYKEEFRSFPSGHTVTATSLIPFMAFLPLVNKKYEKAEPWLFYGAFVLAVIMGFSRMLVGAHYLTDVSFGMLVSSVVGCCIDCTILRAKKEKVVNEVVNDSQNHESEPTQETAQ